ncbi:MAG: Rieske (2Fe-2S) protein [Terriglobia bacterium]
MSEPNATDLTHITTPDEPAGRRGLLQLGVTLAGACYAGALGYPVYRYLATPAMRAASAEGEVTTVSIPSSGLPGPGNGTIFLFGSRPTLLIHYGDGHYSAFDAVCSHLGCTVSFEPENHRIFCPCHGGVYDMNTGNVVSGPPPRGLKPYRVEVKDNHVIVSRA